MATISSLADLVLVRNHLRTLLDSQYRNISRDEDKALSKLVSDLDQLFLSSMTAYTADPSKVFDSYAGPEPEEIIAALKKIPSAVPGDVSVVANSKQLELDFEQKKKVKRIQKSVKDNKDRVKKQKKETLDKETREMNDKIAQAKKAVAAKKGGQPKTVKAKGDGTGSNSDDTP
jgi:hypothetical protein